MIESLLSFDAALLEWTVAHRIAFLTPAIWLVSVSGTAAAIWLLLAAGLWWRGAIDRRGCAAVLSAVGLVSLLGNITLKPLAQRARPFTSHELPVVGARPTSASFPSGHAGHAIAAAVVLSYLLPQHAGWFWGLAMAIAFSRVYLAVHYPSDVVAGALLGAGCGLVTLAVLNRAPQRRRPTTKETQRNGT